MKTDLDASLALALASAADATGSAAGLSAHRATVVTVAESGLILVSFDTGDSMWCESLLHPGASRGSLVPGTGVLIMSCHSGKTGICLGAIGPLAPVAKASVEATESLTLRCGQSSIEMHADGKVLIRGDDVLVRAKGTKRIRAGTVSIN